MPELPEVKAMVERLDAASTGSHFVRAEPLSFTGLKTVSPDPSTLSGLELTSASSCGKFALLEFGGPRIAFHLSQGGRLDIEQPAKSTKPKNGVVRFVFDNSTAFLLKEFGTERKAGWWVLAQGDDGPLAALGPEPFEVAFEELINTSEDTRRLHTILRDQHTITGIGRGYSDDILHRAKLSPYSSLGSLSKQERSRLIESTHDVLNEGLLIERKRKGGLPTKIGDHWIVHGRYGERCPACHDTIARVSFESHEIAYCPTCQTGGKVLADRRLSRLLK
ncbi:MAG: DNA-formamidopyrimidine glycosylase family protein [Actinomycetota bacterium]